MSRKTFTLTLAAVAAAAALGYEVDRLSPISSSHAQTLQPAAAAAPASLPARALPDFSALVEQNGPAVVNISTTARVHAEAQDLQIPGEPGDPFYEFFRRFQIPVPQGDTIRKGVGSGFIVSADGYILTNAHVVDDASEVTVKLTDEREFNAKVIGADRRTDVALVKIDAKNLPVVRIGEAARSKVGEWVAAIGSPFGLENTVTAGIISAKSRSLPDENYVPFIQTDVAVNPGNSGGPLFNMQGEVIGINSQIFSRTGGFMGVSFAIPIDVARNVGEQLIKTGHVVRGKIGVTIQDVNAQLAESFGLARPHGALVSQVTKDGPAAKAGIAAGDVILSVGGHPIERYGELSGAIAAMRPGSDANLTVWRDGKEQSIDVKVAELEEEKAQLTAGRGGRPAGKAASPAGALGLSVRPLAPQEKAEAGTTGSLVVEEVSGPAQAAEVEPGDIILGVNGQRVHTVAELQEAAKTAGKSVALLIQREDAQIFVPLRLP